VGLAQVEFVAGGAVVHSNRRHGLGAVTVKIAGKNDTCCLSHNPSLERNSAESHSPRSLTATTDLYPATTSTGEPWFGWLHEEQGQISDELVQVASPSALLMMPAALSPTMTSHAAPATCATAKLSPATRKELPSASPP
jgi:hypothetical protein